MGICEMIPMEYRKKVVKSRMLDARRRVKKRMKRMKRVRKRGN